MQSVVPNKPGDVLSHLAALHGQDRHPELEPHHPRLQVQLRGNDNNLVYFLQGGAERSIKCRRIKKLKSYPRSAYNILDSMVYFLVFQFCDTLLPRWLNLFAII